jgi:hypothetical protein
MNDAKYIGPEDLTGFLEGKGNPPRGFSVSIDPNKKSPTKMRRYPTCTQSAPPRPIHSN